MNYNMVGRCLTCAYCSSSRPCARTRGTLPSTIMTVSCSSNKPSRWLLIRVSEEFFSFRQFWRGKPQWTNPVWTMKNVQSSARC